MAISYICFASPFDLSWTDEDTTSMLDPVWVANQIVELSGGPFKYRYAKILRNPARVEVVETLDDSFAPII